MHVRMCTSMHACVLVCMHVYKYARMYTNVDVHLRIKPLGDDYWIYRQRILQAIRKAVKKHELTFAKE